jgi:hypothetical protein
VAALSGIELSRRFFGEVVEPLLAARFEGLEYSAALIGSGSEVLGFDTEMSQDHDWGPRVQIFLDEADAEERDEVQAMLAESLPIEFLGFQSLSTDGRTANQAEVTTLAGFIRETLAFDLAKPVEPADWLTFPEQRLLSLTQGAVFRDQVGLETLRERFAYYPDDIWLYQLASVWARIGEDEHLVGRAGSVGDEIGARIVCARIVRDLMRLSFLLERRYAPYAKWFGVAFATLSYAPQLSVFLDSALRADGWKERDQRLADCYRLVVSNQHEVLGTPVVAPGPFFSRPFTVIEQRANYSTILRDRIVDPRVNEIAARRNIGGIDLVSDNTGMLCEQGWRSVLRGLYE